MAMRTKVSLSQRPRRLVSLPPCLILLTKPMDTLINVVIPVFGLILTGYLAGRFEVLGPESAAALTRFVYYFAFPAALFVSPPVHRLPKLSIGHSSRRSFVGRY